MKIFLLKVGFTIKRIEKITTTTYINSTRRKNRSIERNVEFAAVDFVEFVNQIARNELSPLNLILSNEAIMHPIEKKKN